MEEMSTRLATMCWTGWDNVWSPITTAPTMCFSPIINRKPVDLESCLGNYGIRDIPPGFTITSGDPEYIPVTAASNLTDNCRRQSGETRHIEWGGFSIRGFDAHHV